MTLPTVTIVGNVVADPDLRYTASGVAVASFRLACNDSKKQPDGTWADGESLFVSCSAWREMAENVAETLVKGTRTVVTGRMRQRSYETREGEKRTVYEIDVDDCGPSLRSATAKVSRSSRSGGDRFQGNDRPASGPAEDPWASAGPADSEPPF